MRCCFNLNSRILDWIMNEFSEGIQLSGTVLGGLAAVKSRLELTDINPSGTDTKEFGDHGELVARQSINNISIDQSNLTDSCETVTELPFQYIFIEAK